MMVSGVGVGVAVIVLEVRGSVEVRTIQRGLYVTTTRS